MRFENQTFTSDVTLDANEFVNCIFRHCNVIFFGGHYSIQGGQVENVHFQVRGPALNTVGFLCLVRSMSEGPKILDEILNSCSRPVIPGGAAQNDPSV